jgi:hypothetical protein
MFISKNRDEFSIIWSKYCKLTTQHVGKYIFSLHGNVNKHSENPKMLGMKLVEAFQLLA